MERLLFQRQKSLLLRRFNILFMVMTDLEVRPTFLDGLGSPSYIS